MTPRRLPALGALALLVVGGAAACGADAPEDGAASASASSPSAARTPTPTPKVLAPEGTAPAATTAPVEPPDPADFPGMDEQTEEGAQQAFAYYWALAVTANQDGDTTALSQLAAAECAACAEFEAQVQERREKDQLWPPATVTAEELGPYEETDIDHVVVYRFTVTFSPVDGRTPEPASYVSVGGLEWSGEGWKVRDFALQGADG